MSHSTAMRPSHKCGVGRRRVKLRWMRRRKRERRAASSACTERKKRVSEDIEVQSMDVMEEFPEELKHHKGVKRDRRNMVGESSEEEWEKLSSWASQTSQPT